MHVAGDAMGVFGGSKLQVGIDGAADMAFAVIVSKGGRQIGEGGGIGPIIIDSACGFGGDPVGRIIEEYGDPLVGRFAQGDDGAEADDFVVVLS